MLFTWCLLRLLRLRLFGAGELQEDIFQAKSDRAEFVKIPAGVDDTRAPVRRGCGGPGGFRLRRSAGRPWHSFMHHAADAGHLFQPPLHFGGVGAARRRLRLRAPRPRRRAAGWSGWRPNRWATSLPWLMMMTRSQECSTSLRMWVLRMMVCSPARALISSRISMICLGSRPLVGSSRISTSGLWMMAWAMPTRCR